MRGNKVSNAVRRARRDAANVRRNRTARLYAVALKSPVLAGRTAVVAPVAVAPVAVAPERHVTKITPVADGKYQPSCSCGWSRPPMTERGAKGQNTRHVNEQAKRDAAPVAA